MSAVQKIFEGLPKRFEKGNVKTARTFYFSLDDDEKWTVAISSEKCAVKKGKPEKDADCFFKASKQMFLDVWNGKHVPSATDFLTGAIKSNNPLLLKEFIAAFQKKS
ncbi:MAG TPA: SCP2 sterol-binding domain-containing protein [Vicinamibacteria bacterium]|jgi:putative sterol carrier protein|nr:SCP2 sterol-binding domain-containing protein [Vicinamibacteria bacterium]